jgi:[glutamine synthetase] adenylyltransferase / [glutamine synthetase]-adenylyl-L-tyrosine phosphorylase
MALKPQELEERWIQARAETAALHDSVFYRPLLKATASLAVDEVQLSDEEIGLRLAAIGFRDPEGASRHIHALTQGVTRRATIQRTLLPVLIRWMAEGTDPDRALLSFRRLSESLGETPWFLGMLRDSSGAAERLMAVLASSALVSRLLEHIPDSCQWFADESSLIPISLSDIESEMTSVLERNGKGSAELIRAIRRREFLRVAIGAVLGVLTMGQISKALTDISESYLRAMLSMAHLNQFEQVDLCIIAMGRLGGAELGFGSDADAMLLYESNSDSGAETANKIAADLLDLVRDPILHFELDLDLRPEGKNGPRVRTLAGFAGYYEKWAEPWEFQALLRARPIAGSSGLASSFIELIDPLRYPTEIDQKALLEVRRIKARVENERLPQGADPARHLKLGRGSLSDVEWVVQLFQLRYAALHPELRTLSTLDALDAMATLNLAEREQVHALAEAWLLSSRARSALVLAADKAIDVLPTDRNLLESVSRILENPPGHAAELEESYLAVARRSRVAFEKLFVAS